MKDRIYVRKFGKNEENGVRFTTISSKSCSWIDPDFITGGEFMQFDTEVLVLFIFIFSVSVFQVMK